MYLRQVKKIHPHLVVGILSHKRDVAFLANSLKKTSRNFGDAQHDAMGYTDSCVVDDR